MKPKYSDLPLSYLVAFEGAARHLSFTMVAEELNLSQSAISRQIKRLEESLGRPLFERSPNGIHLTPAGSDYFRKVQHFLHDLDRATNELQRLGHDNLLTIATSPSISSMWLLYRLKEFGEHYPEINIRILCAGYAGELDSSEFDLGIFYYFDPSDTTASLEMESLFDSEDVIAVCSPHYLDTHRDQFSSLTQLMTQHPLLALEDHYHQDWFTWHYWFNRLGVKLESIEKSFRSNTYEQTIQAATMDLGIALGWANTIKDLLDQNRLVIPYNAHVKSEGVLGIFTPKHRYPSEPARIFKEWLLARTEILKSNNIFIKNLPIGTHIGREDTLCFDDI